MFNSCHNNNQKMHNVWFVYKKFDWFFFFLQNAFPILYHIGTLNFFKNTKWIIIHAEKLSWCFIFMGGFLKATISKNSSFGNHLNKRSYEDIGAWSLDISSLSYTSSIKGCQLLFNVAFHQMAFSIKVHLLLKTVFHLGLSSIKDHIPLKTVFCQGLSSCIYGIIFWWYKMLSRLFPYMMLMHVFHPRLHLFSHLY